MSEEMTLEEIYKTLDEMGRRWPSNVVARPAIEKFTGEIYKKKYLANEDSSKRGPDKKFLIGGVVVYPVTAVVEWLKSRAAKSWAERKAA